VHARKRVSSNVRVASARCCRDATKNRCPSPTMSSREWPMTKTPVGLCALWDRQVNSLRDISVSKDFALLWLAYASHPRRHDGSST
jgi:hypothetical protein